MKESIASGTATLDCERSPCLAETACMGQILPQLAMIVLNAIHSRRTVKPKELTGQGTDDMHGIALVQGLGHASIRPRTHEALLWTAHGAVVAQPTVNVRVEDAIAGQVYSARASIADNEGIIRVICSTAATDITEYTMRVCHFA